MQEIDAATIKFNETFWNVFRLWGSLSTFRSVALAGMGVGVKKALEETYRSLATFHAEGELDQWFLPAGKGDDMYRLFTSEQAQAIARARCEETVRSAVDAATILFAHGIVDDAVTRYLEVTALAAPDIWESEVHGKKVSLAEAKSASYAELRDKMIEDYVAQISYTPLHKRLEILHRIAPPGNSKQKTGKFVYDAERVKTFDQVRQDIVHRNDWRAGVVDLDQDLYFFQKLLFYCSGLVARRTGVRLVRDSRFMMGNSQPAQ